MPLSKQWFKTRMDEFKNDPEFLRGYIGLLKDEIEQAEAEARKALIGGAGDEFSHGRFDEKVGFVGYVLSRRWRRLMAS